MSRLIMATLATCGALGFLVSQSVAGSQNAVRTLADPRPAVVFKDMASAAGIGVTHVNGASGEKYLVETMGSGGMFFDYDNDGWIDIFLVDGGSLADPRMATQARHRLYRNRGNGTFEDVTTASGIRHREYGMGTCAGDVDNDGWVDVYVTNLGPNILYRNNGNGTFTDVSRTSGTSASVWSASCAFADFDRDGHLDLFVTNYVDAGLGNNPICTSHPRLKLRVYCHPLVFKPLASVLFRNSGKGKFTDVTARAGLGAFRGNGLGVVVSDYDDDLWPDVFVANDGVPNFLYRNGGQGRFTEIGLLAGVGVAPDGKPRAGMGTDAGDYDGDGRLDLVVTNLWAETHSLFRNLGESLFAYATAESGIGPATLPFVGFGTVFVDYDNDTRLDVVIVNGDVIDNAAMLGNKSTHAQRKLLFHNIDGRRFGEIGGSAGPGFATEKVGRGLAAGDIDNDGDLDLLVTNNGGTPDLLVNHGGNLNHSLHVQLVGRESNRSAIGARLGLLVGGRTLVREVKAGSGYLGQSDTRVHFGMGRAAKADLLEIRWPSGRIEKLDDLSANQLITVREGEGVVTRVPLKR